MVPSVLFETVENAPVQWDLGVKAVYQNKFWGGLAYRNEDAVLGYFGLRFMENFSQLLVRLVYYRF